MAACWVWQKLERQKMNICVFLITDETEFWIPQKLETLLYQNSTKRVQYRWNECTASAAIKEAIHLNAIFLPLDMALMAISHSRFKQSKTPIIIPWICVVGYFVNFWMIFGYIWEEYFFLEGLVKLRGIRNIEDLVKF